MNDIDASEPFPDSVELDEELVRKITTLRSPALCVNLNTTRYSCVKRCAKVLKYRQVRKTSLWNLCWHDCGGLSMDSITHLGPLQKINHFPGMSQICQKCKLARTLNRMEREFPDEYNFHPKTWCLPGDLEPLKIWWKNSKQRNAALIVKPDGGCQGNGIFITNNLNTLPKDRGASFAVQTYIRNPYTINGLKFDLRIYVLVTSCFPFLRAFIHKEGLARFCTKTYVPPNSNNMSEQYMHLTNYSINKTNEGFNFGNQRKTEEEVESTSSKFSNEEQDEDGQNNNASTEDFVLSDEELKEILYSTDGNKWSLTALFKYLHDQGHDTNMLWNRIKDIVVKTLLSIQPGLYHEYKACFGKHKSEGGFSCFELLGFDIMIDSDIKPWLIEVNYSPSLHTDSKLDKIVKDSVVLESFILGGIGAENLMHGYTSSKAPSQAKQKRQIQELLLKRVNARKLSGKGHGLENNQDLDKDRKLQVLRNIYEESHSNGFERIFPVKVDLGNGNNSIALLEEKEKTRATELELRYRAIQEYKAPLLRENPVTTCRRKTIERERQSRESRKSIEKVLIGERPKWGSSGRSTYSPRCEPDNMYESSAINKAKESKPGESSPPRNPIPGSIQLSRSIRLMRGKSAEVQMSESQLEDRKKRNSGSKKYFVRRAAVRCTFAIESQRCIATQNLNLNLASELDKVKREKPINLERRTSKYKITF